MNVHQISPEAKPLYMALSSFKKQLEGNIICSKPVHGSGVEIILTDSACVRVKWLVSSAAEPFDTAHKAEKR